VVSTGGLYPPGEGLARAYSAAGKDLVVEAGPSGGVVANAESIHHGHADLGVAFAAVADLAFGAGLNGAARPDDRLRGIAGLQLTALSGGLSCLADQIDPDLGGRRASVGL
jgi:TRAP-type uncharacterized transport system substrate-binding protein